MASKASSEVTTDFRMFSVFTLPNARASNSDVICLASLMTTVIFWSCLLELGSFISGFACDVVDVWTKFCSFSARSIETVVARLLITTSPHGIDLSALSPFEPLFFGFNRSQYAILVVTRKKMRYTPCQLP